MLDALRPPPELGAIGLGIETVDYNQDGKLDLLLGNERGRCERAGAYTSEI